MLASDRLKYAVVSGTLVSVLLVWQDVEHIFKYRPGRLAEAFGGRPEIAGRKS
jgi:hypothetical protein